VVGGKTGKCYNYAIRLSAEVGPCEGEFLSPSCLFSPLFLEGNFPKSSIWVTESIYAVQPVRRIARENSPFWLINWEMRG